VGQPQEASRRAARKCEQAWVQGVAALRRGAAAQAAGLFYEAVTHDPSAADAWLGLHATGTRRDEAVAAMNAHPGSFGALRGKFRTPLVSRFQIGGYVDFKLETHRQLWLAGVCALLDAERLDEAGALLATAVADCDETRFVCARHAFLTKNWPALFVVADGIQDAFLRDESQLYVIVGLIVQGMHLEALRVAGTLPRALGDERRFRAEVSFLRGLACEGLGRADEALGHFQSAYRDSPDMLDVAERARPAGHRTAAASPAAPAPAPETPSAPSVPPAPPAGRPATPTPTAYAAPGAAGQGGDAGADAPDRAAAEARRALLDEAMAELEAMIGLAPVKRQVRTLSAQLAMAIRRREQGLTSSVGPQHLVFTGPPGTGKTTVARIVGKVFAGLGLLERGHVVEAQRADLVGQHLGETALKSTAVIDSALDGVLFVDEAYALINSGYSGGDAFGQEAVQVLLKRAEDDRSRLVVVLAGYPDEIAELLSTNPGLASRFTTRVDFPSYSAEELVLITRSFLTAQGDRLSEDAAVTLTSCCDLAADAGLVDALGNGRFARELARKAAAVRDLRLYELHGGADGLSVEEITTLAMGDVMDAYQELSGAVTDEV
jgi:tetratricopeptide (TPR) repeat protein